MNELIKNGVIKSIDGYDTPILLFEDNDRFSFTEFKIISNQNSLLKCRRSSLNGKIQLVYLKEEYKPIKYLYKQMTEEQLIHVFVEICDALIEIQNNGFLQNENIVFSVDKVFINTANMSIKLVYVPVTTGGDEGVFSAAELNEFFLELYETSEFSNPKIANACRFFSMSSSNATLDELRHFYKEIVKTETPKFEVKTPEKEKVKVVTPEHEPVKKNLSKVLYLSSSNAGIVTNFRIDQPKFVIGRKESVVDGYIPHVISIGRLHCQIIKEKGKFFIVDLGSKNGTFVNGTRVKPGEKSEIHGGDSIRLANTYISAEIREE